MPRWSPDLGRRLEGFTNEQLDRSLRMARVFWRKRRGRPVGNKTLKWVLAIYRDEYERRGFKMPKGGSSPTAEDQADIAASQQAMRDPQRIPYARVRKELGLG